MRHQVTIKDIAKQLNVSVATVSRALRDLPDIHPDTKKSVLDLAAELDYQPNVLATSLVKSRTKTLGLIVPDLGYYFFSTVVKSIEEAAIAAGYSLLITQTQESYERELINIQNLSRSQVEGIIISLSRETVNLDHLNRLQRRGIPLVFFDRDSDEIHASNHGNLGNANRILCKTAQSRAHFGTIQTTDSHRMRKAHTMNWAPTIVRIRDISIKMHVTFVLLLAFEAWMWSTHGLPGIAFGVGLTVLLFTCVVLHELGHALAARGVGIPVREILLLPIGGIAYLTKQPRKPSHELWIAAAGPLVNVVIALVLLPFVGSDAAILDFPGPESTPSVALLLSGLFSANVMLVLFNLLPAFPLDGGRILRAGLAMVLPERTATTYATVIGQGVAVVIGTIAVMSGQIFLAITALFIFFSAAGERGETRARNLLETHRVGDAYNRAALTLSPADRISRVVDLILTSYQPDFAVLQGNNLLGIVTRGMVLDALTTEAGDGYVAGIMLRDFVRVAHTLTLDEVRSTLAAAHHEVAAVYNGTVFLGLVSLVDIEEALLVIDAVERNATLEKA